MSAWGTGVRQSDEFLDVYDEFYDRYIDDADPMRIASGIWNEYLTEFNENSADPILYTVRYALALCLWECGVKDDKLWSEIEDIITQEKDLRFWSDLTDSSKMIYRRRKALNDFWSKINSENAKARKPKKSSSKRLPTLHKGDVFAYSVLSNGYRAAVVLDFVWDSFLIAVSDPVFAHLPSVDEIMESKTSLVFWASSREVVPKKDRILIGYIKNEENYNGRAGLIFTDKLVGCTSIAKRIWFYEPSEAQACMRRNSIGTYCFKDLLDPHVLPKY